MSGMGLRFIACDREQTFLMPPDLREWLPENHFAWFVLAAVEEMDLYPFYAAHRVDGKRPAGLRAGDDGGAVALRLRARDPIVAGDRARVRGGRRLSCDGGAAASGSRDDRAVLERHETALAGLFGEVLLLCARSGLAKVGVIAIDGTKVHANASRDANVDYEQLAREIIEEAKAIDAAEDELYGERRGDELPDELATGQGRRAWLREAQRRLERQRDEQPQPVPRSRPERIKEAKRRLEEELFTEVRANEAYEAYRARDRMRNGRRLGAHSPPKPYTPPATPQGRINTTDPDSHVVKGLRGFIQGYNAQAVTNEHQIVLAAEVMTAGGDFGHLEPMLDATRRELKDVGVAEMPGVVLADAGYWHQRQMERAIAQAARSSSRPTPANAKRRGPGWTGGYYAFMRRVLASERGGELYGRRQPMIEPVFGQTKHNRGMGRFHRRGRGAVRTEWRLITATHNLLKLHRHALATA